MPQWRTFNKCQTQTSFQYDYLIKGEDKAIWENSFCSEIGRLAQGHKDVTGKNTMFPMPKSAFPPNKRVTYGRLACDVRPQKKETHRVRLTAGGQFNCLQWHYKCAYSSNTNYQNPFELSSFNTKCQIFNPRHKGLLFKL